jgi:hypothetical protein
MGEGQNLDRPEVAGRIARLRMFGSGLAIDVVVMLECDQVMGCSQQSRQIDDGHQPEQGSGGQSPSKQGAG